MAVFGGARSCCGVAVQRVVVGLAAGVALGAVVGASAAPAAMEPIDASAGGVEVGACARPLADVVWGFVLVLLALAVSLWGSVKSLGSSVIWSSYLFLVGVFAPLQDLGLVIVISWLCVIMVWKCHKLEDPEMRLMSFKWTRILLSLLNPWSKLPARILAGCDIVLYLPNGASPESKEMSTAIEKAKEGVEIDLESPLKSNEGSCRRSELLDESWAWLWESMKVEDVSEAMVIGVDAGRKCKNVSYDERQLGNLGKVALLWGTYFRKGDKYSLLPGYGELKFLRGNSGFATIAIAIQAIGYIYGILFRSIKGLRVAPIEVIGLILNIILLVKACHYSICNPCHRPLVLYMNEEEEEEFLRLLNSKPRSYFEINTEIHPKISFSLVSSIVLCVFILLVYYIVTLMRDTNIMIVVPLILFLIGIFGDLLGLCCALSTQLNIHAVLVSSSTLLNAIAYCWAMVVTLQYWKCLHFNNRPKLVDLSQIIPFIG